MKQLILLVILGLVLILIAIELSAGAKTIPKPGLILGLAGLVVAVGALGLAGAAYYQQYIRGPDIEIRQTADIKIGPTRGMTPEGVPTERSLLRHILVVNGGSADGSILGLEVDEDALREESSKQATFRLNHRSFGWYRQARGPRLPSIGDAGRQLTAIQTPAVVQAGSQEPGTFELIFRFDPKAEAQEVAREVADLNTIRVRFSYTVTTSRGVMDKTTTKEGVVEFPPDVLREELQGEWASKKVTLPLAEILTK